jgi:hypothetical protein
MIVRASRSHHRRSDCDVRLAALWGRRGLGDGLDAAAAGDDLSADEALERAHPARQRRRSPRRNRVLTLR